MRKVPLLCSALFWLTLCACGTSGGGEEDGENGQVSHERLFVGTGEYSASDDWHAVLRFDAAEALNGETGGPATPAATIPIKETADTSGIRLNFAHRLYYVASRDELYVASLFTNADNSDDNSVSNPNADVGSISVIRNASSVNGAQTLARHIFGENTGIVQPHGIWIDESRDILYVANTFGGNILVFDNASTVDGDTAPSRTIDHAQVTAAVHLFIDEANDRMFVANMAAFGGGGGGAGPGGPPPALKNQNGDSNNVPAVLIYNNASTLNGDVAPAVRITGDNTRLSEGNNQTTHNVWFNSSTGQLFVGHHTNEVLIFDLSNVNLSPSAATDLDLAPRVLEIHEAADDSDLPQWSVYGFYLVPEQDRLYVSCGFAEGASESSGGGPTAGAPPNEIKIYEGVSAADFAGQETPVRTIHWDNGDTYYPPQPIWVSSYQEAIE